VASLGNRARPAILFVAKRSSRLALIKRALSTRSVWDSRPGSRRASEQIGESEDDQDKPEARQDEAVLLVGQARKPADEPSFSEVAADPDGDNARADHHRRSGILHAGNVADNPGGLVSQRVLAHDCYAHASDRLGRPAEKRRSVA
jgi:hypothetical protein